MVGKAWGCAPRDERPVVIYEYSSACLRRENPLNQHSEVPATRKEVISGESGSGNELDFSTRLNIEKGNLDGKESDFDLDSGSRMHVLCGAGLGPVRWG